MDRISFFIFGVYSIIGLFLLRLFIDEIIHSGINERVRNQ